MRPHARTLLLVALAACQPSSTAPVDASSAAAPPHEADVRAALSPGTPDAVAPLSAPSPAAPDQAPAPADPFAGVPVRGHDVPFRGTAADFAIATMAESSPPQYALDGRIDEWAAAEPSATLPASAGRGKIWIAFTEAALLVAGDLDASAGGVRLDKVRIDLALPPPVLPPIAINGYFVSAVVDESWCRTTAYGPPEDGNNAHVPTHEETEACLTWLSRCRDLRAAIAERFQRTIIVDLAKGTVSGAPGVKGSVAKARGSGTGESFEVALPSASFPETAEMPLRTVRMAARAFSDSPPKTALAGAAPGEPSWKTFTLATERRAHRLPELVASIARQVSGEKADEITRVAVSYVPSPTSSRVRYFYNQTDPPYAERMLPSPQVVELDVATGRKLFTLPACAAADGGREPCAEGGPIEIGAHAAWIDDAFSAQHPQVALVSTRGPAVLDVSPFTSFDPYTLVRRPPGAHILDVYQGCAGDYCMGQSGAARGYRFEVMTMDGTGHFGWAKGRPADAGASPGRVPTLGFDRDYLMGAEGLPGFEQQCGNAYGDLWIDPALKFFGLKGSFCAGSYDQDADFASRTRSFEVGYRWNAAEGAYALFGRTFASPPDDAGAR
jgi:hypothetical protein